MTNFLKITAALGLALGLGVIAAPDAGAKGHAQGLTDDPGSNVGSQTVSNSQAEGSGQGQGMSVADTPAGESPGASGSAGQPDGSGSRSAGAGDR